MTAPAIDIHDGGLRDLVFDAQTAFRRIMDGFAAPGSRIQLGQIAHGPGLAPAAAAVLATLCDHETPVWMASGMRDSTGAWLRFHTGAPCAPEPAAAAFACITRQDAGALAQFATGTAEYPDRSTTVLLAVAGFTEGPALRLSGPGIETTVDVRVEGLPDGFVATMEANRALYPMGIDIILVCGHEAIALPRTTRLMELG